MEGLMKEYWSNRAYAGVREWQRFCRNAGVAVFI